MITLDEFITRTHDINRYTSNSYVTEPGFKTLYVRRGPRYFDIEWYDTLDIASIEACHPGQSTFKALITRLRREYPLLTLYVENVQTERFEAGLVRMAFRKHPFHEKSYWLRST